jgi:RNA polymerase primary sigma factor
MKRADYRPRLSSSETEELATKAQAGDQEARAKLVEVNDGLVRTIARKFMPKLGHGLDLEDLHQYGRIGLIHAIDTFDATRSRFSTHASYLIGQSVVEAIRDLGDVVRTPKYVHILRFKLKKASRDAESPSAKDASKILGIDIKKAKIVVAPTLRRDTSHVFVSQWVMEDDPCEINDDRMAARLEVGRLLEQSGLSAKQREDVERSYGIGRQRETRIAIGASRGLTPQAITKSKNEALAKMRKKANSTRRETTAMS